ncbi:MAG: VOC family protein [Verrucomicrobia bacterium]|nr:VOC family protein [Verrucomicrobiota bacterium]
MIRITEIAFTGYPVTDLARARTFYEKLLGLTPAQTFGHGDKQWIEYAVGAGTIAISNMAGEMWKPSPDGPGIAFEVENFDAAIATLKTAGVRFVLDAMTSPTCRMAIISDPDGNSVVIHQRNAA